MTDRILITASTGQVGPFAARALLERGHAVRALVLPDDERASVLPDGVEIVTGDLSDPAAVEAALDGVSHVFWMWPFFYLPTTTAPAMVERMSARALRVCVVSSVGVHIGLEHSDNNCHAYLEELLTKSQCRWTFLRTTGFMGNARGWAPQIRSSDVVRFPYGEARRTSVHERDLAEAGVHALLDDQHVGKAYLISGTEALSQREQVEILGGALGRDLDWLDVEADEARAQMVATGWPPSYADGALDYFRRLTGEVEVSSNAVAALTGRPAASFHDWARENADVFR